MINLIKNLIILIINMKIQLKPEFDQCVIIRQDVVVAVFLSVAWMTSHQAWQHCVLPQGYLDMFRMIMMIIVIVFCRMMMINIMKTSNRKAEDLFKLFVKTRRRSKEPVQTIFNEPVQTEPESHLLQVHEERPRDQETSLW